MTGRGVLRDVSTLMSSAFGVGVTGRELWRRHDRVSLRLSQPLRVESGHATLRWAAGRTRDRRVQLREARLNLQPSARQLELELAYTAPLRVAGSQGRTGDALLEALHVAALAARHPSHIRAVNEFALLWCYRLMF